MATYVKGTIGGQLVVTTAPVAKPIRPVMWQHQMRRLDQKIPAYAIVMGIEQYRQNLPQADFADHDASNYEGVSGEALGVC